MDGAGAIEVWRGGVNAWECDEMGHMNVRFHLARALQGLAGAASALGMTHAYAAHAAATLVVRELHIRFHREARVGAPLHMTGGVVEMGETDVTALLTLIHSRSGDVAATFLVRADHAAARDGRPFAWPDRAREAAQALRVSVPDAARPRSLVDTRLAREDAGLATGPGYGPGGRAVVMADDCDVFGRMRPELVLTRASEAIQHLVEPVRAAAHATAGEGTRVGGAALEYRLVFFDQPRTGDHIEVRSGFVDITAKTHRFRHWLLDPRTGVPWAAAENVSINFDLNARKLIVLGAAEVAGLQHLVIPS